ncbi:cytochrome o ubiquinol oxidase subunit IV [Sphingosinicella sp. BN140058]|uniref:cytochrome o ubiquinol oxidase subunit IV n=1 Tax=Sphingosinicella sp. BN140058 TaxID=1892855 RepID=UPI001011B246|nr:cytochrome o ubiquinol oxidase subunit IV [Sphingosinicella sp. BN140058]QAY75374.1 cytochrome o ubiquinol oxidase subunit IV [Sphingosinicella sp. BN140058]
MSSPSLDGDAALHSHGDTHGHGSRRGYLIGTILSILLTAVPFWLVMSGGIADKQVTAILIFAMALIQIVVHVLCFLHLDTRSEGGWTLIAFLFTVVIVVLMIGGSVWVMFHLNTNMMPMPVEMAPPIR